MKLFRKTTAALTMCTAVAAAVLGMAVSASANSGESFLYRGQSLNAGDQIQRSILQGTLVLIMQGDGNLVEYLYPNGGSAALVCWASNTYGSSTDDHAVFQQDGNFVVYTPWGHAVWASNTVGVGGSTVDMNVLGVLYVGTKPINNGCGF